MKNTLPFTETRLLDLIEKESRRMTFNTNSPIMGANQLVYFIPIVTKGCIRVLKENENGTDIFLYHINKGETCISALYCCQTGNSSFVKSVAEGDTEVLLIPANFIEDWMKFPEWKNFIYQAGKNRFDELLNVIDLVTTKNMNDVLLHYLESRCKALNTKELKITHQKIADELGIQREAVSRLLYKLQDINKIIISNHSIKIV